MRKMKQTTTGYVNFKKVLTNNDILTYAKNIGELRKKIDEAEAAKNTLKTLQKEMSEITKILEKGEISDLYRATYSFHDPKENFVTITPPSFASVYDPIIREMTPEEKEKYCQHTLEFEESEEETPEETMEKKGINDPKEGYVPDYIDGGKRYYIMPTKNRSFPWVLWLREYNEEGKILENKGVFWGTTREEIVLKLQSLMFSSDETINDELDEEEDDGLYIDNYHNQIFYVRPKNDKSKLLSYYHNKETAERFIELYKIHKDDAKVREIILNKSIQPEHLLNSTGDYDMIENEDGSVSARTKEESGR